MSLDAQAPVFTWIDSALSHAEAGTLPNFIEEFRLAAMLSLGHPGTPNAAVIPALREADTLEPWYDFLVDLAQAS